MIAVSVVLCLVLLAIFYYGTSGFKDWKTYIQVIGLAISSIALLIAFWAFFSQRIALNIQIEDSKQTKADIVEQSAQNLALFKKIDIKNEQDQLSFRYFAFKSALASLVVEDEDRVYRGPEVFEQLFLHIPYENYHNTYEGLYSFLKGPGDGSYSKSESLPHLTSYFNLLYCFLSYLDTCVSLSEELKNNYIKTLRAGFSPFEVVMLYYHGLMRESNDLRRLLEKYHVLEDIDFKYVIADNNQGHYEEAAFGCYGSKYTKKREEEISNWPCNKTRNSNG